MIEGHDAWTSARKNGSNPCPWSRARSCQPSCGDQVGLCSLSRHPRPRAPRGILCAGTIEGCHARASASKNGSNPCPWSRAHVHHATYTTHAVPRGPWTFFVCERKPFVRPDNVSAVLITVACSWIRNRYAPPRLACYFLLQQLPYPPSWNPKQTVRPVAKFGVGAQRTWGPKFCPA